MNRKNSNNQILVNYALSLQKSCEIEISAQELTDFISGQSDNQARIKVLKALNNSPDLLQQWLEINQSLGYLNDEVKSKTPVFLQSLINFIKKPWLIPTTAMALGLMLFLPQWLQPSNQDIIDGIYQQWPPINSHYESLPKTVVDNYDINNQQDLLLASIDLGRIHWRQFSQKQIKWPNLCDKTEIDNCQNLQKLGIQWGKIKEIVDDYCHKNPDHIFWQNLQLIDQRIKAELNDFKSLDLDIEDLNIDFEFCQ